MIVEESYRQEPSFIFGDFLTTVDIRIICVIGAEAAVWVTEMLQNQYMNKDKYFHIDLKLLQEDFNIDAETNDEFIKFFVSIKCLCMERSIDQDKVYYKIDKVKFTQYINEKYTNHKNKCGIVYFPKEINNEKSTGISSYAFKKRVPNLRRKTGCYLLYDKDKELIYVGASVNLPDRMYRSALYHDAYFYSYIDLSECDLGVFNHYDVENYLIEHLNPKNNIIRTKIKNDNDKKAISDIVDRRKIQPIVTFER